MKKGELQELLNYVEGDPEIVIRGGLGNDLQPLEDIVPVKAFYRKSHGHYTLIKDDSDFTDEQKEELQHVVLLRV